jgi:hypothetical protein
MVILMEEIQCSVAITVSSSLGFKVCRTSLDDARFGQPSSVTWDEV